MKYQVFKFYPHFINLDFFSFGMKINFTVTNYLNPTWNLTDEKGILVKEFTDYSELKNYCRDYEIETVI